MTGTKIPNIWRQPLQKRYEKNFSLTVEDHLAVRYARNEALPFGRFAGFVTLCAMSIGLFLAHSWWRTSEYLFAALVVSASALAGFLLSWLTYRFFKGFFGGFWKGFLEKREAINVPLSAVVDQNGIEFTVRKQVWFSPWDAIESIEEDEERFYFWVSKFYAHIMPKRVFDHSEAEEFALDVSEWSRRKIISPPQRAGTSVLDWESNSANSTGR